MQEEGPGVCPPSPLNWPRWGRAAGLGVRPRRCHHGGSHGPPGSRRFPYTRWRDGSSHAGGGQRPGRGRQDHAGAPAGRGRGVPADQPGRDQGRDGARQPGVRGRGRRRPHRADAAGLLRRARAAASGRRDHRGRGRLPGPGVAAAAGAAPGPSRVPDRALRGGRGRGAGADTPPPGRESAAPGARGFFGYYDTTQRLGHETFDRVSIEGPAIEVDTSDGYRPGLEEILAFVNG